ncbi:tail fiber assembly protein [Photorhabdus khanii]|nr:tail fiber assembly protein [Photorhabdus khanii]
MYHYSPTQAWKKYRVMLNRVDTSKVPEMNWPTLPL